MKVWEFMTISENPPPWKRSCNKVQHHLNLQCLMRPSIFRIIWFAHYLPHMPYYLKSTKNLSNLQAPLWVQVDDMLKWTVTFSFLQASMDGQVMATQQYKKLLGSPPAPILGFRFVIPICYSKFFSNCKFPIDCSSIFLIGYSHRFGVDFAIRTLSYTGW